MGRCEDSGLKEVVLEEDYLRDMENSSKGTQLKYFKDNVWYKQNRNGYEGKAETLCSLLLSCTDVESYVDYAECRINGRPGCMSHSFLGKGEECVTLQRLYEYHAGGQLYDAVRMEEKTEERILYVIEFVRKTTGLDMTNYLSKMLALDMVTLNIDRHFHNICLIRKENGAYRLAPIFDNGAALLSNYGLFPAEDSLGENIDRAVAAPFSGSFRQQAQALGLNLRISREIWDKLQNIPDCRAKKVLVYQLKRYGELIR